MTQLDIEDIYPASPVQQGMLFHYLLSQETGVYLLQIVYALRGRLNAPAFRQAWQEVTRRHPALRTSVVWEELEEPLQVVHRNLELPLEQLDWSGLSSEGQEERLQAYLKDDRARGFDLVRGPLMRMALVRLSEEAHYCIWTQHHLTVDGWSRPLLLKEAFAIYEARGKGQPIALPESQPYRAYIEWLQERDWFQAEAFWRRTLAGLSAPTSLGVDRPAAGSQEGEAAFGIREIRLPQALTAELRRFATRQQVTLNTLVQGAWAILLSRYSGEQDVLFGSVASGRSIDLPGIDSMVGCFVNTLPVRVQCPSGATLSAWLKELQARQLEIREYEYTPLIKVQSWSEVPRDQPLFESLLVFENYPVTGSLREPAEGLSLGLVSVAAWTHYPLALSVFPEEELTVVAKYDRSRLDSSAIDRMLGHFHTLLEGVVCNPAAKLEDLPILTSGERHRLVTEWNDNRAHHPTDQCFHQLFEAQVARTPDSVAVVYGEERLTYRELNERANQLARYLQKWGVGPEVAVAIFIERSPTAMVALLGVLKAGGAYLPLDPKVPGDRLSFVLTDARPKLLLTRAELAAAIPAGLVPVVCVDSEWERIGEESRENPLSGATVANMAYIIFTSGSTGRPKGVVVEHRHLLNHIHDYVKRLGPDPGDNFALVQSLAVDASIQTMVLPWCTGGCLHIIPHEMALDSHAMVQYFRQHRIDYLKLAPSHLAALHGANPQAKIMPRRWLILGGEATRWEWMRGLPLLAPECRVISQYGPTETAVAMMTFPVGEALHEESHIITPLGRAITNTSLYVMDPQWNLVPIGVTGELYIGGPMVSRGYLNRPDVTAERYIPNPFSREPGARLYKTGDLVRFLPDGNIQFVSRADDQVKIRGFRVELGEVQAELGRHPGVEESLVMVKEETPGEKRLVAFVVAKPGESITPQELREYLRQRLPDYMVPAAVTVLPEWVRTPHGKVDRRGLLELEETQEEAERAAAVPRTPVEEMLTGIWASVLGLKDVGLQTSFFDMGGDSLRAAQLVARMRDAFRVQVPLRDLFEAPTVAGLARRIERALAGVQASHRPLDPVSRDQELPLSFAQQRLWFLDQLTPGVPVYNVPLASRLRGRLNFEALSRVLDEIIRRHEALRSTFPSVGGRPVQHIAPMLRMPLPFVDLTGLPAAEREERWERLAEEELRRPFDLATGPLIRAALMRLGEEEHILVVVMHHIVTDWWSNEVFMRELRALYGAFAEGRPSPLPELSLQYADFALWQREWLQGEVLESQLAYWKQQLGGHLPVLQLPTDRPRPAVQSFKGATYWEVLPKELQRSLQAMSRGDGVTVFMALLAAFGALLYRLTAQEEIMVGSPIAGRNRADLEGIFGFFVNTLVMRTDLSGRPTFRELLRRVREVALEAYAHQDIPFEKLVELLQPDRDPRRPPLFQVSYGHRGGQAPVEELPGLEVTPVGVDLGLAKFDLGLFTWETDEGLGVLFDYNTDLFSRATVRRWVGYLRRVLEQVTADPEQLVIDLPLLDEAECSRVVREWNQARAPQPEQGCIHQLFEQRAAQTPDAVAVVFRGRQLTYKELNEHANQLAHRLAREGVGPEVLVGLMAERSLEMIAGILGILKSGGAYVPLDPGNPPDRLALMLEDARLTVLVTEERFLGTLPDLGAKQICLDRDWHVIARESRANPAAAVRPEHLAYMIYTSGSTGRPHGVLGQHRELSSFISTAIQKFGITAESRVCAFASISYDASIWQIFMGLCSGAKLCMASRQEQQSIPALVDMLRRNRVTFADLPVVVLDLLPEDEVPELRTVSTGGERCPVQVASRWSAGGRHFYNVYGPTEATVATTAYLVPSVAAGATNVPIGRPFPNVQTYILDSQLRPVPVGVPGELHIGGAGVVRGYLNRPELTAWKFIPDPFGGQPGARLYRTGDLARYLPDGNTEFLGRTDNQVKVRGFRIELEEIQAILSQHPDLQESIVTVWGDGPNDRRLVAYFVPKRDRAPDQIEIRRFLRQKLPEYMIPTGFIELKSMPRTPSRKIDKFALPAPDRALERAFVAPRSSQERQVAEMWAELLRLPPGQMGVQDSFFSLGGHSLLATQLLSRIRETFQIDLSLLALFESPTIEGLAAAVMTAKLARVGDDQMAELLRELDQLSEEEAARTLAELSLPDSDPERNRRN